MEVKELWHGRYDGNAREDLRLWQVIKVFTAYGRGMGACFVGYDTDEGIKRNKGRGGANLGPNAIRSAMQSLPNVEGLHIWDYLNLANKKTEEAQEEYAEKIAMILKAEMFPIGLGGGHDIAFGSYLGIRKAYPNAKIGIVNVDTHLDMRDYSNGRNSGTSFKEIMDLDANVLYANVGFKPQGNTERLILEAKKHNALLLPERLGEEHILNCLADYAQKVDLLYVTFCMDVFDASDAPGVSAPTIMGLAPKSGMNILQGILAMNKVACVDFAEVSPPYDEDGRTAKLAGLLAYEVLKYVAKMNINQEKAV